MQPILSETLNGYTIAVHTDDSPESPAEWDTLGEILYTSSRYTLGSRRATEEEIAEICAREDVVWLPVYAYVHSGVTIRAGSPGTGWDRWDSGQSGIAYVTYAQIAESYGHTPPTPQNLEAAKQSLGALVDTWDRYFRGEVYGYTLTDPHGETVDSCWGFYDDPAAVLAEAKNNVPSPRELVAGGVGTDSGPACPGCTGTVYGYSSAIGSARIVAVCIGCDRVSEFPAPPYDAAALRAAHVAHNGGER